MKRWLAALLILLSVGAAAGCVSAPPAASPSPAASPAASPSPAATAGVTESSYAVVTGAWEDAEGRWVELDYVSVVSHSASELADDGAPYGYAWLEIRNYNEQTRTYRVSDSARFRMSTDGAAVRETYMSVDWEYFRLNAPVPFAVFEVEYPAYFYVYIRGSELVRANFYFEYYLPSIN